MPPDILSASCFHSSQCKVHRHDNGGDRSLQTWQWLQCIGSRCRCALPGGKATPIRIPSKFCHHALLSKFCDVTVAHGKMSPSTGVPVPSFRHPVILTILAITNKKQPVSSWCGCEHPPPHTHYAPATTAITPLPPQILPTKSPGTAPVVHPDNGNWTSRQPRSLSDRQPGHR